MTASGNNKLKAGDRVEAGGQIGEIESVKAVSDLFSPVSGEIVEVNEPIVEEPGKINEDPEGDAWFFKMKVEDLSALDDMMDEKAYKDFIS